MLGPVVASALAAGTVFFQNAPGSDAGDTTVDVRLWDALDMPWEPNTNYGALDILHTGGRRLMFSREQSTLIRFDVSSVPSSAMVLSAQLTVYVDNASDDNIPIYLVSRSWTEAGATWNVPWGAPGAKAGTDRSASSVGNILAVDAGFYTWSVPVIVVQNWVTTPAANFGLLFGDANLNDAIEIRSSEWTTPPQRPQLDVSTNSGSFTFRQGLTGYAGCSDTTIANADDPATVPWNLSGLLLSGGPDASAPSPSPHSGALLRFELSSIPPYAQVEGARLVLTTGSPNPASFMVQQMLRPWDESASWRSPDGGATLWQIEGARGVLDKDPAIIATLQGTDAGYEAVFSVSGVQVVQAWVRGAAPNYGVEVSDYAKLASTFTFDSESVVGPGRPRFEVTYTEGRLLAGNGLLERQMFDGGVASRGALDVEATTTGGAQLQPSGGGLVSQLMLHFADGVGQVPYTLVMGTTSGSLTFDGGVFWEAPARIDVLAAMPDAGPPDAGPPDAGPPDAGPVDAGPVDAGTPDSGFVDAGRPDAGRSTRVDQVACGCGATFSGVPWLALAALLLRRRRWR